MKLKEIYSPIEKELERMEGVLADSLKGMSSRSLNRLNDFLLESPGKRIRPAMTILSAKASSGHGLSTTDDQLIRVAAAVELIHMASLIHDDVIDHSPTRHNRPTVNSRWGQDVSIALGDYLYSVAFEMISECGNVDIVRCISCATSQMCEGELLQVCERDNVDLLKESYILIVKKKTASLFAASCQAGGLVYGSQEPVRTALGEYGLNFGVAFQITDDYLDLMGEEKVLGKEAGQDIKVGEMTLPILNLLGSASKDEASRLRRLLAHGKGDETLSQIRKMLSDHGAETRTKQIASSFVDSAKQRIGIFSQSSYKTSLLSLADHVMETGFNLKG